MCVITSSDVCELLLALRSGFIDPAHVAAFCWGTNGLMVQGVMMLPAAALPAQGAEGVYKRLWVHEVFRVFYDRLVDDADRLWLLAQVLTRHPAYTPPLPVLL